MPFEPVAVLRRRRSPDQRRRRTCALQVRLRALPPGELPRRRRRRRVDRHAAESRQLQLHGHPRLDGQQHARSTSSSVQVGRRKFDEPNNSTALAEYFSSGNTLQTGANIVGDQNDTGDIFEVRDTFFTRVGSGTLGAGPEVRRRVAAREGRLELPGVPDRACMIYVTDTRALPLLYAGGTGAGQSTITTEPDLRLRAGRPAAVAARHASTSACATTSTPTATTRTSPSPLHADGARQRHEQLPAARRLLVGPRRATARTSSAAASGLFTGRFLLVPAHIELQQNGYTGRIIQQRINGALLGLSRPSRSTRTTRRRPASRSRATRAASTHDSSTRTPRRRPAATPSASATRGLVRATSRASTSRATTRSSSAT